MGFKDFLKKLKVGSKSPSSMSPFARMNLKAAAARPNVSYSAAAVRANKKTNTNSNNWLSKNTKIGNHFTPLPNESKLDLKGSGSAPLPLHWSHPSSAHMQQMPRLWNAYSNLQKRWGQQKGAPSRRAPSPNAKNNRPNSAGNASSSPRNTSSPATVAPVQARQPKKTTKQYPRTHAWVDPSAAPVRSSASRRTQTPARRELNYPPPFVIMR